MPHGGAATRPSKPLGQPGATANWKKIKTSIIKDVPPHLQPAPCQVKSIAVRDACKAVSNAKKYNAKLKGDQARGLRTGERCSTLRVQKPREPLTELLHPSEGSIPTRRVPQSPGQPQNGGTTHPAATGTPASHSTTEDTTYPHQPRTTRTWNKRAGGGMGPGSSPGPGDKDVHHLVLGNRRGTHRPGRLRRDPTPLPAPGQPHRQDRQGAPDQTPQHAEGRRKDAQPHSQPDG